MKTIKIIDLLNKITKDEIKQGTKFKMFCCEYIYDNGYIAKTDANKTIEEFYISQRMLNDEVEIIEEEKEIEKLTATETDFMVKPPSLLEIMEKINEVIEAVNELKGKSE